MKPLPTAMNRSRRDDVGAWATEALTALGYTITQRGAALEIRRDGTYLGDLLLSGVYGTIAQSDPRQWEYAGEVTFEPRAHTARSWRGNYGHYRLKPNGTFNLDGLRDRLRKELPKAVEYAAARKAAAEQDRRNNAIKWDLYGGDPDADTTTLPPGVGNLAVYNGKVDLDLRDLPPERAKAVLDLMRS